jgi:L-gulonolactone oxidase
MVRTLRRVFAPSRNWAGNQRWVPARRVDTATTTEVAAAVRSARADGLRVKVLGGGHSFTAAATTDGVQLSLDGHAGVTRVDREARRVTVGAGIRIFELNRLLAEVGLAMPNLGDIDRQSIAGAIATATHGTGLHLGNLATTVVEMELVTGSGEVVRCSAAEEPDIWRVARVGLGALGVVTEVTLQCVDAFNLHARETVEPVADLLEAFEQEAAASDHFEFFMMPGGRRAQVKRNHRTDAPAAPPSRWQYTKDKLVAENLAFGAVCRVGRRFPTLAPRLAKLVTSSAPERELVDRSDRVFCSPRHVRFVEMEYGLPIEHVPAAVRRVCALAAKLPTPVLFPIEVRVSAADDIPLSTAFGRPSGWIAVHQYHGMPYEEYFAGVEAIMDDYEGRPHWGKLHQQRAATLRTRYPEWDHFALVRDRLDPERTFANPYLDRVLGP